MKAHIILSSLTLSLVLGAPVAKASTRAVSYTYNTAGQVLSVDGPRTDVADITRFEYDAQGNRTRITNALGHVTQVTAYDANGRPLTVVTPNGLETQLGYDVRGRLVSIDRGGALTGLGYDAVGHLTATTAPDGTRFTLAYDDAHRLTAICDTQNNCIHYTLDAMDNHTRVEVFDAGGKPVKLKRAVFDKLSRTIESIGAVDQVTRYSYDANGNRLSETDANGNTTGFDYDALNRLIRTTDPLGGTVNYGYDAQGNLIAVTDANGNTTRYVYDGLGNLTEQHSPDTGITTYTHDDAGNILSQTDAKGQTTSYQYDALNRLTQVSYADGATAGYSYDTCQNGIGHLCTVSDSSGRTSWQYDAHGRITARSQSILVNGVTSTQTTAYQYNSAGQLVGITYPSGMQVGYSYESGKVSAISVNGTQLLDALSYSPFGPVTGWTWGNGAQSWRGYDLDGRLIYQSMGSAERTLDYDANSNITDISDPANSQHFGYDALNRLEVASSATFSLGWQYDANGNRLNETRGSGSSAYTIDEQSNQLLAVNGIARQHDANGQLINDGEHSYQYDARHRLISVDDGSTGEYSYNALGQRVYKKGTAVAGDLNGDGIVNNADLKSVNGNAGQAIDCTGPGKGQARGKGQTVSCVAKQIGNYANHGQGNGVVSSSSNADGHKELLFSYEEHRLLGEYDIRGNAVQETVWLGDIPVATVQNGVVYYIHTDQLGSPRVITDANNTEVWRWDSDPFGTTAANEDPDGDGNRFAYNLRFPGQYYDGETANHYNYYRDYNPSTGRYIESDPIGLTGGMNTYTYVGSNPAKYEDVYGLAKRDPDSQYCKSLERRINNLEQELEKRYKEYEEDPLGLPERIGPGEELHATRRGHITKINETDSRLKKNLKKYMDECGPPPPPAPKDCPEEQKQSEKRGETQCSIGEDGSVVCRGWWGLGTPYLLTPEGPVFPGVRAPSTRIIIPRMIPVY